MVRQSVKIGEGLVAIPSCTLTWVPLGTSSTEKALRSPVRVFEMGWPPYHSAGLWSQAGAAGSWYV